MKVKYSDTSATTAVRSVQGEAILTAPLAASSCCKGCITAVDFSTCLRLLGLHKLLGGNNQPGTQLDYRERLTSNAWKSP